MAKNVRLTKQQLEMLARILKGEEVKPELSWHGCMNCGNTWRGKPAKYSTFHWICLNCKPTLPPNTATLLEEAESFDSKWNFWSYGLSLLQAPIKETIERQLSLFG